MHKKQSQKNTSDKLEQMLSEQGELFKLLKKLIDDNRKNHFFTQEIVDKAFQNLSTLADNHKRLDELDGKFEKLVHEEQSTFRYPYSS